MWNDRKTSRSFFNLLLLFHSKNFHFKNILHYMECIVLKVFFENIFLNIVFVQSARLDSIQSLNFSHIFSRVFWKGINSWSSISKILKWNSIGWETQWNSISVLYKDCQTNLCLSKDEFLTHSNSLHSHHFVNSPSKILP